jgi:hypothetical protein
LDSSKGSPTSTTTTLSKEEIIDNHMSVWSSFGLSSDFHFICCNKELEKETYILLLDDQGYISL